VSGLRIASARLPLFVLCALLALAGTAIAAKPKPAFAPKIGEYVGTATKADGSKVAAKGQVSKNEGKLYFVPLIPVSITCPDGSIYPGGVGFAAVIKGRSLGGSEKGESPGGEATYKLRATFTAAGAISGTASKELVTEPGSPLSQTCTTGTVKFSLHLK
jgi:hypothetical protein